MREGLISGVSAVSRRQPPTALDLQLQPRLDHSEPGLLEYEAQKHRTEDQKEGQHRNAPSAVLGWDERQ